MSSSRKVFAIFVIVLVFVMVDAARDGGDVYKQRKHQKVRKTYRKPEVKKQQQQAKENEQQNFHEVDAFGDDFVDFGAQTGPKGQFSWHADFPLE